MKFKKYVKESTTLENNLTLNEDFFNPDAPSMVRDEIDTFYAPVEKLIKEGKFDEARKELDAMEADLLELEAANAKKKFFRFPKFMIEGQKKQIATLRAKLPQNESLDDMDRRCEKCNTLLNDGGTCPKCDDGEEDLNESIDNTLQKDAEKILKHACDKPELLLQYPTFEDYIDELSVAGVFTIPESVPSVGFKVVDVENISETEAAEYIKLLLDKTWLRERLEELSDSLVHNNGFRYDMLKDEFRVGDRVAHRYADEYNVGTIKDKRENEGIQYEVEWDYSEGDKVEWLYGDEITHWVDAAPVNEELSNREKLKRAYPELNFDKESVTEECTNEDLSVREKLKRAYPELNFDKEIAEGCEPVAEELSNKEKLKRAYPELNFDADVVGESVEDDMYSDYDDEYDIEDDVEMDRRHAALYGGDRMYCDCGAKLSMDEWGSYCPRCTPKDPEEVYEDSDDNMFRADDEM